MLVHGLPTLAVVLQQLEHRGCVQVVQQVLAVAVQPALQLQPLHNTHAHAVCLLAQLGQVAQPGATVVGDGRCVSFQCCCV